MTDEEFVTALKPDEEERALLKSIESGEWVSIPNDEEEIARLRQITITDRSSE